MTYGYSLPSLEVIYHVVHDKNTSYGASGFSISGVNGYTWKSRAWEIGAGSCT